MITEHATATQTSWCYDNSNTYNNRRYRISCNGIAAVVAAPFLSDMEGLSAGIGAALIALGIAYFVMAYGLWKGNDGLGL